MEHKVLLVDDDANLLSSLKRALHKEPYAILLAASGEEGLELLQAQEIDVVVSDQDMAGLCGTAFLKIVRQKHPETVRFMLTGKATLEVALQAINEGEITHFFQKPCSHIQLSIAIRQALVQRTLLSKVKELLRVNQTQSAMINELEKKYPGISRIDRDQHGSVLIEGAPAGYSDFLQQLSEKFSTQK